ncbi:hypothetical protein HK105_208088 [Polyrhizophydium stewartii]|uniref:Integral membrane protein n=1 Tax=Polyrhizophydium stewartii TaxID=2732419 RepID=A0ABR4MYW8_9FUNG|nr:hypothetical protein HK105_004704 [Polyrhizophydium stewartii]
MLAASALSSSRQDIGPLEIFLIVLGVVLLIVAIARIIVISRAESKSVVQRGWLITLSLLLVVVVYDTTLALVPSSIGGPSLFMFGVIYLVVTVCFFLCQTTLFKAMPRVVRLVPPSAVTVVQVIGCVGALAQVAFCLTAFAPFEKYRDQVFIAQNVWQGYIAIVDLAQNLLLIRFISIIRDVPWYAKARFGVFFALSVIDLVGGQFVLPSDRYTSTAIGDLLACLFAVLSMFCLEAAAKCQTASNVRSEPRSTPLSHINSSGQTLSNSNLPSAPIHSLHAASFSDGTQHEPPLFFNSGVHQHASKDSSQTGSYATKPSGW